MAEQQTKFGMRSFLWAFLGSTAFALGLRLFVMEDFRIASASMSPTLLTGDMAFVSKVFYGIHLPFSTYRLVQFRSPSRGEVVAFSLPDHGAETFVKRIVAIGGDQVSIRDGALWVNGERVTEEPTPESAGGTNALLREKLGGKEYSVRWALRAVKAYGPVSIPPDRFFALGDNRDDSTDSRVWGPIPNSLLKGKVSFLWLSLSENNSVRWDRMGSSVQ